jgi:Protein of unknown function (DUF1573)
MKKIFFISALSAASFFANAQAVVAIDEHAGHNHEKEAVATSPKLQTVSAQPIANNVKPLLEETLGVKETEYNFGKIPQGKPVTHVFTVANTGKVPFKLDNVQASCGCTTPVWDKEKVIAVGTSSDITVGYNAAAEGPFTKSITITYNGTQSKVIQIKGEVWKTPTESAPTNAAVNDLKN